MTTPAPRKTPLCWVVTDGRAGNETPALALAEAIAARTPLAVVKKRLLLAEPWRRLPRSLLDDAFRRLDARSDSFDPPFPDLWIGCGRASVALTIAAKSKDPAIFTVQLQDPRAPAHLFDLVIPPRHDGLKGENVFAIIGAPCRTPSPATAASVTQGGPIAAVLIGGANRAFDLTRRDAEMMAAQLKALVGSGVRLRVTTSRRTPPAIAEYLRARLAAEAEIFWRADADAADANPYPQMLAGAAAILVTEDSVNMATEAAASGVPVFLVSLTQRRARAAKKFRAFHQSLIDQGAARIFDGALDQWRYPPLDETGRAADEVIRRWRARGETPFR